MLQKNTFLRPTNALPQSWLPIKRHEDRTLYRVVTVDPDSLIFEPTPVSSTDYHDLPLRVVSACPLLKRPVEAQGFWAPNENPFKQLEWNPCSASPHQWYLLPAVDTRTGPLNWKQMFLANPPCKSVRCAVMWEGWAHGVLVITLEATRHVYRQSGVTLADLFDDTYNNIGTVIIETAYNDGHLLTIARKGGGFVCAMPTTSLHEQVEKYKKKNGELEMRLNNHSTVALLWTVTLTDDEHKKIAANAGDEFFFTTDVKTLPTTDSRRPRK